MSRERGDWIPWYCDDSAGWLELSLAARGAAEGIARKMGPKRGELHLGSRGLRALTVLLRCTWEELEPALAELLAGPNPRLVVSEDQRVLIDPDHASRKRPTSAERVARMRKRRLDEGPGCEVVYFLRKGTAGPIKIGTTTNLVERVNNLRYESDEPLTVIGYLPGSYELEKQLHERFAKDRLNGEWFKPTTELVSYVASVALSDVSESGRPGPVTLSDAPSYLISSDLISDPEDPSSSPRARSEIPPPPDWWAGVCETVEANTGEKLRPAEAWLRYAGHRHGKRLSPNPRDAGYWLATVLVREAREERHKATAERERQRQRAGPVSPGESKFTPEEVREQVERVPFRRRAKVPA